MKLWVPKQKLYLLKIFPKYSHQIATSRIDEYLLYILILLNKFDSLGNTNNLYTKINIISKIMRILYARGIDIILKNIKEKKYQRFLRIILNKLKELKEDIKKLNIKNNEKNECILNINNVYDLIKIKIFTNININIIDDIKDNILEYY
jgi:hypothetical protein